MTATLISLLGLVAAAALLTWWVYAPKKRASWDAAAKLPFEEQDQ